MRFNLKQVLVVAAIAVGLSLTACKQETPTGTNEASNATRAAAKDAYIYGYPLVLMDVTRAKMTNVPSPSAEPMLRWISLPMYGRFRTRRLPMW